MPPVDPNQPQSVQPPQPAPVPVFGGVPQQPAAAPPVTAPQPTQPAPRLAALPEIPTQPEAVDEEQDELDSGPDDALLEWQNVEPALVHRPTAWYIGVGVVAAASIIVAIILQAWIFIPLGILVPIALTMYGQRGPGQHHYTLNTHTIEIDGKHFAYDLFQSFYEIKDNGQTVYELVPVKRFGTLLSIHTSPESAAEVGEILATALPETEPKGNLGESVFNRLRL